MKKITLFEIVQTLGGELAGGQLAGGQLNSDADVIIHKVGSLAYAEQGAISFLSDTKHSHALAATQASAVIIKPEHVGLTHLPKIVTDNPYAYFAKVSSLLNPIQAPTKGTHATAVISTSAKISSTASISAHVVIGDDVVIGDHVVIKDGSVIENNVTIGESTLIEANVVVRHGTKIGKHCHLYAGCVIGNDGFGYAEEAGRWIKIPQVGRVIISDYVDVGANTTIDRGAIDDTVIEEGVKLDNLIQIAHNCRIGAHTVIAGCVGIAGSAIIGKHCKIGGAAMILGHLKIADDVTISPGSMIMRSIHQSGTYTALMPFQEHQAWLKTAANIRHLNELTDKIKALEDTLKKIASKDH